MSNIAHNDITDYALVEKVLGGDTSTFSVIISNTERLVAHIIFKMVDNAEDRRDIAQDVYVKAFQKLSTFRFQSKLSTWIGHIAYNACCNYLSKKRLVLVTELADGPADAPDLVFKGELSNILNIQIEQLPPLYKTLITLFHTEELSYAEIGQITELPEGTVKSYLYRARKALKENILKNYNREDLRI